MHLDLHLYITMQPGAIQSFIFLSVVFLYSHLPSPALEMQLQLVVPEDVHYFSVVFLSSHLPSPLELQLPLVVPDDVHC